jgi:hypothetical protein
VVTITQADADELGFGADPTGPQLAATLVGVMDGPNDIQDPTPLAVFPASLLDVGDVGIATTVGAIALEPGASIDDLRAQLDSLPNGDVFGLEPAEWVPADVRVAVSAQGQGLAVVAAIVAAAGIAVVGQLVSRQGRGTRASGRRCERSGSHGPRWSRCRRARSSCRSASARSSLPVPPSRLESLPGGPRSSSGARSRCALRPRRAHRRSGGVRGGGLGVGAREHAPRRPSALAREVTVASRRSR